MQSNAEESRPLRTTVNVRNEASPEQSAAAYSNFALTTNLNNMTLNRENNYAQSHAPTRDA